MKKVAAARDDLNKQRMEEDTTNGFEADKEAFDEVVMKFETNNKRNYRVHEQLQRGPGGLQQHQQQQEEAQQARGQ